MALIPCPKCGHNISSFARFCPKCSHVKSSAEQKAPRLAARSSSEENSQENTLPPSVDIADCTELLQHEFEPSLDEMIVLQGKTFLVKGPFNIHDCYAYLTSKRFILCDSSRVNIVFQVDINKIAFAEESRHLISKMIVFTTVSGETFQIKCQQHFTWLSALSEPKSFVDAAKRSRAVSSNVHASTVDWFYEVDGINVGPVKEKVVVQLIQNNHTIFPHTKVWNAGLTEWKPAKDTILTIYFSDLANSGADKIGSEPYFRIPGLSVLKKYIGLIRKYL